MRAYLILTLCLLSILAKSQVSNPGLMDTIQGVKIEKLSISAYLDVYYGSTSSKNAVKSMPYFVSMNQTNEFTVNLAYIDLRYTDSKVRARLAPGFGTYIDANYAAESGSLKNIVEASVGYKPFKNKELWIDVGILGSPYTNESAISKDHLMYTRSLAPEYVPYYLSGLKISMPIHEKINAYLYLLNGWQQIQDKNSSKAFGTQIEYRPNNKNLINWNTYIGDERSNIEPNNRMRYFTDIYWIFNPEGKFSITSCLYTGIQERLNANTQKNSFYWWQTNMIGRYKITPAISISGRVEYFNDANSIQITPLFYSSSGFKAWSSSLCLNANIHKHAIFRLEARRFDSKESIFINTNNLPTSNMYWFTSNISIWF